MADSLREERERGGYRAIHRLWGRGIRQLLALLLSCTLIIVLLRLNVSVLGLVEFTSQGWVLVLYTYGVTLLLNILYLGAFAALERRAFPDGGGASAPGPTAEKHTAPAPAQL